MKSKSDKSVGEQIMVNCVSMRLEYLFAGETCAETQCEQSCADVGEGPACECEGGFVFEDGVHCLGNSTSVYLSFPFS